MAVNLKSPDPRMIFPVEGVELGTARAGIQLQDRIVFVIFIGEQRLNTDFVKLRLQIFDGVADLRH